MQLACLFKLGDRFIEAPRVDVQLSQAHVDKQRKWVELLCAFCLRESFFRLPSRHVQ